VIAWILAFFRGLGVYKYTFFAVFVSFWHFLPQKILVATLIFLFEITLCFKNSHLALLYILGGLLVYSFAQMGGTAAGLQMSVAGVRWRGLNGLSLVLDLDLNMSNPSRANLAIGSILIDISVEGQPFAEINEPGFNQEVAPQANSVITFPVRIALTSLPSSIRNLILAGRLPRQLEFTGQIRVNGVLLPVRTTFSPMQNVQPA
jgi:hypothetical protein